MDRGVALFKKLRKQRKQQRKPGARPVDLLKQLARSARRVVQLPASKAKNNFLETHGVGAVLMAKTLVALTLNSI
jgi:hypothetical protein